MSEIKEMNIYQKLSKITSDLEVVAKNLSVSTGRSSYKAVGEADILSAVKPLEEKYNVYSYATNREIINQEHFTTETEYNGKKTYKNTFHLRMKVDYKFVNTDNPNDFIVTVTYADGLDSGDKGTGKAMTYADKYALMKTYKIITGEDPDQTHSDKYATNKTVEFPISSIVLDKIKDELANDIPRTEKILKYYNVKSLDELNATQGEQCYKQLSKSK